MTANRMARFAIFIGTWNTTGEVLETEGTPASTLSATDAYRWLPDSSSGGLKNSFNPNPLLYFRVLIND